MNFIATKLKLEPPPDGYPSGIQASIYAEAAILQRIATLDPDAGRRLHEMQRNKPMTVVMLEESDRQPFLRLTFFGDEGVRLSEMVMSSLAAVPILLLGEGQWTITTVETSDYPWAATATWDDILQQENSSQVLFKFGTPTAFTKKDGRGNRVMNLFPDPVTLFTGLAWKWDSINGVPLPGQLTDYLAAGGCAICGYDLRTVAIKLMSRTQIGFVGSVLYECLYEDSACIAAINQLARLAFFTGCGYQVSRGMGAVRTEIRRSS